MKKKIRTSIIVFLIIAFLVVTAVTFYYVYIFLTHVNILKTTDQLAEHYSNYSIEKSGFILKTKVIESDDLKFVAFTVYSLDENNIVFESNNDANNYICRLMDFDGIEFADGSLDIIVKSNDTGTFKFCFTENNWHLQEKTGDG